MSDKPLQRIEFGITDTTPALISNIERLSMDICVLLALNYLDVQDTRSLLMSSRTMCRLFSHDRIWQYYLLQDFGAHYPKHTQLKKLYDVNVRRMECERLIAYSQVFLNPVSPDVITYPRRSKKTLIREAFQELRECLTSRDHPLFMAKSRILLSEVNVIMLEEQSTSLLEIYQKMYNSSLEKSLKKIADLVDNCESGYVSAHMSATRLYYAMVRLLARVGASKSLDILLCNLSCDPALKTRFMRYFGGALLCDAINYHKPSVVHLLLLHGASISAPATCDEYTDHRFQFPLECAVQSLYSFYQDMTFHGEYVTNHMYTLKAIEACLKLICHHGGNPDRVTFMRHASQQNAQQNKLFALPLPQFQPTIRQFATTAINEMLADGRLCEEEKQIWVAAFMIVSEYVAAVPMDFGDDDFNEDSDERIADTTRSDAAEPSPKKAKTAPGTPENEFDLEPETPTKQTGFANLSLSNRK